MSANYDELEKFKEKVEKLADNEAFLQSCTKELAARLLAKTIKRTPVGKYPKESGIKGGTLRRGWTGGEKGNATDFVNSLEVHHVGGNYVIEIVNPVEYASYVEYGHRTRNGEGWVNGRFMLTISEKEIQTIAPKLLEAKLNKWLKDVLR